MPTVHPIVNTPNGTRVLRKRLVVLNKIELDTSFSEIFLVIGFGKKSAVIAMFSGRKILTSLILSDLTEILMKGARRLNLPINFQFRCVYNKSGAKKRQFGEIFKGRRLMVGFK